MDVMLSDSEKEQFLLENMDVYNLLENIKSVWENDYSWINIQLHVEEGLEYRSAKDIFRVIFDNLILNSIQQNDAESILEIHIYAEKKENISIWCIQIKEKDFHQNINLIQCVY